MRPSVVIFCTEEVADALKGKKVGKVYVLKANETLKVKKVGVISTFEMVHDVETLGFGVVFKNGFKFGYLTDSGDLTHVKLPRYDLVVLERNHDTEVINENLQKAHNVGNWFVFGYLKRAKQTHLSFSKADEWVKENDPLMVINWHESAQNGKRGVLKI
jgi:hypothetical protein